MSEAAEKMPKRFHLNRDYHRAMLSGGYGGAAANTTKNATIGWFADGGSPAEDIDNNTQIMRQRARDLDASGGLARSANITMTTNVVSTGLVPKPKPDVKFLGMTEEAASEWIENCKREWELWAGKKTCSADLQADFSQLQELAMHSQFLSGDCFALLPMFEAPGTPYQTHIRLLEADRVGTPDSFGGNNVKELQGGAKIIDGVEVDNQGIVVAFHIADRHPLSSNAGTIKYTKVEAYGKDTGMPNVLHMVKYERPEQRRGVPLVAAMIVTLKQLTRYTEAELMANVIKAMFTVFIQQSGDNPGMPEGLEDVVGESDKVTQKDEKLEMAPGAILQLRPGETVNTANPMGPNANYEKYFDSMCMLIASSFGIPKSILLKKFESNYTAARGELLEFWKEIKLWRVGLVRDFCQPSYEAWMAEAVATGRIEAPGFFDDPAIRAAWCRAQWQGSTMGSIDPKKEAEAAVIKINNSLSTAEREAAEINGSDVFENMEQRKREIARVPVPVVAQQPAQGNTKGEGEEEDE